LRKGFAYLGVALFVLGVALFFLGAVESGRAGAAFMNCFGGTTPPFGGFPTACTDAMNAVALWQGVMGVSVLLGIAGLVFLILGVVLQPQGVRAGPPYAPAYPPPVYAPSYPPPVYTPPQEPRTPPPGTP
jgi:hypothetical protein